MKTVRTRSAWAMVCAVSAWGCSTTEVTSTTGSDASASGGAISSGGARTGGATGSGGKQNVSSGGASSGGASSGGASSGGAGGRASGGKDASADAPSEGAASDAALVCSNTDGGRDAGEHWHDFSANQCKACPAATTLTCQDLLASPGPSFDPATHVLTLHVSPGKTEIRTARYSFNFKILLADGGGVIAGNSSVAGSVDRDTVTIDLSKALLGAGRHLGDYPASETTLDAGALNVKDACGTSIYTLNSTEGIRITFADGGTPLVVCHKIP